MNKLRSTSILLGVWIGVAQGQVDTNLLTFENALQIMQEKNPALQQQQKELEQKQYEKAIKRGLYMPRVGLSAKAVAMSDPLHLDLSNVQDAILPIYETLGNYGVFNGVPYYNTETGELITYLDEENSTTAVRTELLEGAEKIANANWDQIIQEETFATVSADITWPLFTGGKIAGANKAAGFEVQISEEEYRKVQGELLTELVTRYYGLVLAIQASDVMKEKYDAMLKHYSDAQKMFDEGMIAKVELLSAKVALSDAEREYKVAIRMIETIRSGLSATLATEPDTCFILVNNLFINDNVPELDYWLSQTWDLNPLLKQIDYKQDLVEIKSKVNKGSYLPTIALIGTYNLADYQLSHYVPNWMVGAGLKWTIFEGMARNKQISADRALTNQVLYIEDKAHEDLRAYITKLYNELNNELVKIDELQNTIALAHEYCLSTEKAFNEGFSNSTDVVEAQSKLAQVKALQLKAFYQYDVTLASLLQVSGLSEQFITYCSGENTIVESIE